MITVCQLLRLGALVCAVLVAACSFGATRQPGLVAGQSSTVEQKLVHSVFVGEWKPGYVYQITFRGTAGNMAATVHVADPDNARITHDLPARVVVFGTTVEVRYLQSDRVDKLIYSSADDSLEGQSITGSAMQDRWWAKRAVASGGGDAATVAALFPEFTWAPVSPALFTGRDADGVLGAICMNSFEENQETLMATCGMALAQQVGIAPTSADSLTWTGYNTFKTVGPNSGNLVVVVGKDKAATMDASVRIYKKLERQPDW